MATNENRLSVTEFKGLRNDKGQKFLPPDYFFQAINVNYDDMVGSNTIQFPSIVLNLNDTDDVDGIFEFKFLDEQDTPKTENITIVGGTIYTDFLSPSPTTIVTGLFSGKCRFGVMNNKLFIVNGRDYPKIYDGTTVYEMGAPRAEISPETGNPNGTYFYEITYVTSAGEERIGTRSNTISVSSFKVGLTLPIGYAGTTSRKIYRTINGGNAPKLLATVADNTTLTYTDNTADGSLGADIIAVNNECPRPYFIEVLSDQLVGAKSNVDPLIAWVSGRNIEVWDTAEDAESVANQGNDNTPIQGIAQDYAKIIVGTEKNIYTIDLSGDLPAVSPTRANVGVKNGYSMVRIPKENNFPGGVLFASTLNDIRLFNGNFAQPVPTSLDNLETDNWAQPIRGTIATEFQSTNNFYGFFFEYKYHLIVGQKFYVFDIRNQAWSTHIIQTDSYFPTYNTIGQIGTGLYFGQQGASIIEQAYQSDTYRGESYTSIIETQQLLADYNVKYIQDLSINFVTPHNLEVEITLIFDGNNSRQIQKTFTITGGAFDAAFFSREFFETVDNIEDYRTLHISRWARWFTLQIKVTGGLFYFRGYSFAIDSSNTPSL